MNLKQGLATGVLAIAIVTSVALMPVSAEVKDTKANASQVRGSGLIAQVAPRSPEQPAEPIRDLTYN